MRWNLIDEEVQMDQEWRGTVNRWNKDVKEMEMDTMVAEYTDLEMEKVKLLSQVETMERDLNYF